MTAPERKWVAEAMELTDTLIASVNEAHHSKHDGWRDACFSAADQTVLDIRAHLQRQADLMERMAEALAVVAQSGDFTCFKDAHWDTVNAALTAFQESKQ